MAAAQRVADGVWRLRGGVPVKLVNVFLLEDGGGVTLFDAGIRQMSGDIARAAAEIGPLKRIVLGNCHADHRGGAPGLGAPVLCHAEERADAEGDGGAHYFDYGRLGFPLARPLIRHMMGSWDAGPVKVVDTLADGDEVAGFRVLHLPGHSPGLLALWRERDRLAITNDAFALFDPQTSIPGGPRIPHAAFTWSTDAARESLRRLAALDPATAWPGHFGPLAGDVRPRLEAAAGLAPL
jgi:glyoxylase-like metal-dependent hydrolase (beta-lactamase superfamily II)